MRVKITLRCNECKQRNYNTTKNKKNNPDRLEMNKYAPSAESIRSIPKPSNWKEKQRWQRKRKSRRITASGSVK